MAWRNGKGLTLEIASQPPTLPDVDFDWRISLAYIEKDSAFSLFPGVDRTIAIIKGGLTLRCGETMNARLEANAAPFRFSGDLTVEANHIRAPSTALNVMTQRKNLAHLVHRSPAGLEIMIISGHRVIQGVLDEDLTMTIWYHSLPAFSHGI